MSDRDSMCPGCFEEEVPPDGERCPTCGWESAQDRPPLSLPIQTELKGRYTAGRVLGDPGGFGVTYLGYDRLQSQKVAIKEYFPREAAGRDTDGVSVVPHSGSGSEEFAYGKEQFMGEAQTLATFDHANIVSVRDFFEANGTAYLVMEYYEGKTLEAYLEEVPDGKMDPEAGVEVMLRVLDGLKEVHREGYLHRDVKPENVYLTKEGRPILIDFGAAREALGERSQSLSVVMTPGYAPYEQYSRKGNQGPHTDVYGAGATLYRMVTGEKPEPATDRVIEDTLQPPHEVNPEVPEGLSRAVIGALAMGDQERTSDAGALQDRLQDGEAQEAPSPSPGKRASRSSELQSGRTAVEDVRLARVLDEHEDEVTSVAFSPDTELVATGSADGTARLWSTRDGELVHTLRGSGNGVTSVAFSPDGQLVATGSRSNTARLWSAERGELANTLRGHEGTVWSVVFSPGGKRVATGSADGSVKLWSAQSGELAFTFRGHKDWMKSVVFSPDSKLLATGGENAVRLWSTRTGEVEKTLRGGSHAAAFSPDGQIVATGSAGGTAKLWSADTGEEMRALRGHDSSVSSIAFSPGGNQVVTGCFSGTAKLWSVKTGEKVRTLPCDEDVVSVAFSPDGQFIVTGVSDGTGKLWHVL